MGDERTKDGVPKFDGTPEKLPAYTERAIQYSMGVEYHKRYLCGPRLLQELTGVAKVITRTVTLKNPQWLSHPRGVYQLLQFLEEHIQRPSLIEASKQVAKFFYNMQRARGETMTEWISRHAEVLWEASAALRRVQAEYENPKKKFQPSTPLDPWQGWQSQRGTSERSGPFREDGMLAEDDEESIDGSGWRNSSQWKWEDANSWWSHQSWRSAEYEPPESWDSSDEIFIPEFLAGFLLLHRCGLEPSEKSNILAAIKGEFSTTTVAKALREQWSDSDLIKRDKQKAPTSLVAEMEEDAMVGEEEENPDLEMLRRERSLLPRRRQSSRSNGGHQDPEGHLEGSQVESKTNPPWKELLSCQALRSKRRWQRQRERRSAEVLQVRRPTPPERMPSAEERSQGGGGGCRDCLWSM